MGEAWQQNGFELQTDICELLFICDSSSSALSWTSSIFTLNSNGNYGDVLCDNMGFPK